MLAQDTACKVGDLLVASFGPRQSDGDEDVVGCAPAEATFWSVFTHAADGTARWLVDVQSREDAEARAHKIAFTGERLTVAFMAIGAARFFAMVRDGGGLESIDAVVKYARVLDTLVDGVDMDVTFAYDIAQPLGYLLAEYSHGEPLTDARAVRMARLFIRDLLQDEMIAA